MKKSLFKRAIGVGAGITTVGLLMTATPAHAATNVITFAGSETTEVFDNAFVTALGGPANNIYNVPVLPNTPFTVPAGQGAPAINYIRPPAGAGQVVAPNGSSAGVNAVAGTTAGIPLSAVDVGRSSRDYLANSVNGGAGDAAGLEFWAFAKDGVSWASKSLQAPAAMTPDQLRGIYLGTITNWNQLPGGGNGTIQRYLAQANSGTQVSFYTKVLGFQPLNGIPGVTDFKSVEENRGRDIASADRETAIYPYSLGKWAFQFLNRTNASVDLRDGTQMGAFYTPSTSAGSVASAGSPTGFVQVGLVYSAASGNYVINAAVATDANAAPGTGVDQGIGGRYLYHVLNPAEHAASYTEARGLVGTGSTLASGAQATLIRSQGFLTLTTATIGDPQNAAATGQVRFFNTRNTI